MLRDRSGLVQVVVENPAEAKKVAALQPGSIVKVVGLAVDSKEAQLGAEIHEPEITVEHAIREAPPVEYYKPEMHNDLDYILDHRPIALRNKQLQAVFRIQAEIAHAIKSICTFKAGAVEYFAPNLIGASSEGGAEFFNVDYFGYTATLAQSSQLYKQIMVGVNERVFALIPFSEPSRRIQHAIYRKESSSSSRDGFFGHWHEILDIQEECIKYIVQALQERCADELDALGNPLINALTMSVFPRLTFAEAQELYFQRTGIDERSEPDLSPQRRGFALGAAKQSARIWSLSRIGKRKSAPFMHIQMKKIQTQANTFDQLCAGVEITSGGQRRHTYGRSGVSG